MTFSTQPRDESGRFGEKPEVGVAQRLTRVLREALGHDGSTEPPPEMGTLDARLEAQSGSTMVAVATLVDDRRTRRVAKAETLDDVATALGAASPLEAASELVTSGLAKHAPGQLVAEALDLLAAETKKWDPRDHPRDRNGRFASIGAIVSLLTSDGSSGGSGKVIGVGDAGRIRVRKPDGSVVDVDAKDTEVTQSAPDDPNLPGEADTSIGEADTSVGEVGAAGKPGTFGGKKPKADSIPQDRNVAKAEFNRLAQAEKNPDRKRALRAAANLLTGKAAGSSKSPHEWGAALGEKDEDHSHDAAISELAKLADELDAAGNQVTPTDGGPKLSDFLRSYVAGYRGQPDTAEPKASASVRPTNMLATLSEALKTDGGFTFDVDEGTFRKDGFAVAVPGMGKKLDEFSDEELDAYMDEHWEALEADPNLYLGGWVNPEDGSVWLDLSEVHDDMVSAVSAGRDRGEIAVFDLAAAARGEEGTVPIGYTERPKSGPVADDWDNPDAGILKEAPDGGQTEGQPGTEGGANAAERGGDQGTVQGTGQGDAASEVTWGKPYGGEGAAYDTPDGPVTMRRKGQRVRFFDADGNQVGPEQANVAPAVAYAHSQGWSSPSMAEAGITPDGGMDGQATAEVPADVFDAFTKIKVPGRVDGAGTVDDPIDVEGDLDKAVELLAAGKHVRLNQVDEVATLLDKLRAKVDEAKAKGEKADPIDLCKVTVPGTSLFCTDTKGIPRAQMPQLGGTAKPGSPAAAKADKDMQANIEPEFREALAERGIDITDKRVLASHLRATQAELDGVKVSMIAAAMNAGKVKEAPIFVTRDGYIIDGHHRWAANLDRDVADGELGDIDMPVEMIDMDIGAAIDFANEFASQMGIEQQGLAARLPDSQLETPVAGVENLQARLDQATSESLRASLQAQIDALKGEVKAFTAPGVAFTPQLHPRDENGRFIDTFNVGIPGGFGVAVSADDEHGTVDVRTNSGVVTVAQDRVTQVTGPLSPPKPDVITIGGEPFTANDSLYEHLVADGQGGWKLSPERQALHNQIVDDTLHGVPESTDPTFFMLGGGPAAGKSTMLGTEPLKGVPDENGMRDGERVAVVVNPDNVKVVLPEYQQMVKSGQAEDAGPYAHEESSIVSKRIQKAALSRNLDVLLDGTGDSSEAKLRRKIQQAHDAGYRVKGFYATIPTDVAWERADLRSKEPPYRHVKEKVLRNIHASVSDVFPKAYDAFDEVTLFDTLNGAKVIAVGVGQKLTITDSAAYQAFLDKAQEA